MMIQFFAFSISLLSAAFALGAVVHLYIRYRTNLLRMMMLFLISLLAINTGFWIDSSLFREAGIFGTGMNYLFYIFQLIGGGLNIIILPHLTSALVSIPFSRITTALLWVWNSCFVVFAVMWFLFPAFTVLPFLLSMQQTATIFGSLVLLAIGLKQLRKTWWRGALVTFFYISAGFLLLLIADILISTLPLPTLRFIDNLSLPLYLLVLNGGIFYFSGKFLSREALVQNGSLTEHCISFYKLTKREAEILEELILGRKSREIADRLCISVKTVENHLYSIYQKIDVKSRLQLMHVLNSWSRD